MQIIPAIDVLDSQVVRLRQGDFTRVTNFGSDPLAFIINFEQAGATKLHLVNLSGARNGELDQAFVRLIVECSRFTKLDIQVGGGIRTLRDIQSLLDAGASKVVLGTMLFENPCAVKAAVTLFGKDRIIAALDTRGDEVRIHGWQRSSGADLFGACNRAEEIGIGEILVTDTARDGMNEGPNVDLYRAIRKRFPSVGLIASGGVRSREDVRSLEDAGCRGVVIGKALLDRSLSLGTLLDLNIKSITYSPLGVSTLAIRVIPCLDVTAGRVVKGTSFQRLRDAGDPVKLARRYCDEGADELVLLDITATKEDRGTAIDLARRVADAINIPFTIGGGIRSVADAREILDAGADKVSVNSAAVTNPELLSQIAQTLGSANTVCAIDAKRKGSGWLAGRSPPAFAGREDEGWVVLTRGGSIDTGIDAIAWAEEAALRGAGELLLTSYDRDGTGEGFDTELLAAIKAHVKIPVIASGGGGTLRQFVDAVKVGKADAVLAASVFHFQTFSIRDVKQALATASLPVRLL
jgi:cyclase